MKITKISIPIYCGYLRIVVNEDLYEAAKAVGVDDEGNELNDFGAFVTTSKIGPHSCFNVFFRPNVCHMLIAHEVVHLVNAIYVERHIKLDVLNDEPQAYLTGWITEQIYKTLKKQL